MLPDLNFILKVFIKFSVSSSKKLSIDFMTFCNNDDETKSQNLRKIVFDNLGAKDQREFEKIMEEEINVFKDKVKEKIKKRNNFVGQKWFSEMMRNAIEKKVYNQNQKEVKVNGR